MELGGKSPLIVFDDADIDSAVGGAMLGNFYSTGQVCSNGTRVFVNGKIKSEFLKRLKARTFTGPELPEYYRLWFGDEAESQEPVTFWEELHDDRDGIPDRRIFQSCMLFARDLPGDGRELLLAIQQENENEDTRQRETSFEIMIGVALGVGEFRA
jgi:hypothetical protein